MIESFLTDEIGFHSVDTPTEGCWVNVVAPTADDRRFLTEDLGVDEAFMRAALDDEESSHVDYDDESGQTLVILDCPFVEDEDEAEDPDMMQYDTHPLSVLFLRSQDMIVTISLRENAVLNHFACGKEREFNTHQRTRFLLRIFLMISQAYVRYLRTVNRQFIKIEKTLHKTMQNGELVRMLGLEKSLVYFSTSLRADEATLQKIANGRVVRLYQDDKDLLEDVSIELKQAIEMSTIYSSILNGTMDAFSSVINNNLNTVMRTLTVVTIVLAIPTILFSFYGMNVEGLPIAYTWLFPLILSLVLMVVAIIFFRRNKLFR
ncbi:magnesium transporter CorA family protein [Curtanaerobium respiraculi]|uniref:magnesium transporter CorA family protein n=1 Tax=Curtanaerobium respiraculi TaxID=2949669 RepID=UPI0024B3C925|nr:magnesium transporter CorA family protein [Curtanaerobium respiraculi]